MPRLCMFGCRPPGPAIPMHRIPNPARHPERFRAWVSLLGEPLKESDYVKYKKGRVCDIHFSDQDRTRNKRLNIMAVPSLNVHESDVYERKEHDDHTYEDTKPEIQERPSRDCLTNKSSGPFMKFFKKIDTEVTAQNNIIEKDTDPDDDLGFNDVDRTDRQVDFDVVDDLGFDDYDDTSNNTNAFKTSVQTDVSVNFNDSGDGRKRGDILNDKSESNSVKRDEGDDVLDSGDDDDVMAVIPEDSDGKGDEERYIPQEHDGFRCNVCLGKIVGFRYRCCECEDYDMCSDCESRGTHPLHFVLRVPGYRQLCEVGRVLAAIRLALAPLNDVKQEPIKVEDPVEEAMADPLDTEETDTSNCDTAPTEAKASTDDVISPPAPAPSAAKKPREGGASNKNGGKSTLKVIADKHTYPVALDALRRKAVIRLENVKLNLQDNIAKPTLKESVKRRRTCGKFYSKKKDASSGTVSKRSSKPSYSKRNHGNSEETASSLQKTAADYKNIFKSKPSYLKRNHGNSEETASSLLNTAADYKNIFKSKPSYLKRNHGNTEETASSLQNTAADYKNIFKSKPSYLKRNHRNSVKTALSLQNTAADNKNILKSKPSYSKRNHGNIEETASSLQNAAADNDNILKEEPTEDGIVETNEEEVLYSNINPRNSERIALSLQNTDGDIKKILEKDVTVNTNEEEIYYMLEYLEDFNEFMASDYENEDANCTTTGDDSL